jgi:hypothetical protein
VTKTYDKDEPINPGKFLADHGAKPKKSDAPFIMRDYYNGPLAYDSPLSGRHIASRDDRRKEMKEFNVREVDPSESPFHRKEDRHIKEESRRKHGMKARWAR